MPGRSPGRARGVDRLARTVPGDRRQSCPERGRVQEKRSRGCRNAEDRRLARTHVASLQACFFEPVGVASGRSGISSCWVDRFARGLTRQLNDRRSKVRSCALRPDRPPEGRGHSAGVRPGGHRSGGAPPGYPNFLELAQGRPRGGHGLHRAARRGAAHPEHVMEGVRSVVVVSFVYGRPEPSLTDRDAG